MRTGKTASILAGLMILSGAGGLAAADRPLTPQQEKMVTCNQEAKAQTLKGAERQTFMSECLKAEKTAQLTPQQERMKDCNKQAAGKKGEERKAFMKQCLSSGNS
jgi:psiF repeat